MMHRIIETPANLMSAKEEGIGEDERGKIVTFLSEHPGAGDLIKCTGGARGRYGSAVVARARAAATG